MKKIIKKSYRPLCTGPFLTFGWWQWWQLRSWPAGTVLWCPWACCEPWGICTLWALGPGHLMVTREAVVVFMSW